MRNESCVITEITIWLHILVRSNARQILCKIGELQAVREVLQAIPYSENDIWVHTDKRLMPKRRETWASWNFLGRWASFFASSCFGSLSTEIHKVNACLPGLI